MRRAMLVAAAVLLSGGCSSPGVITDGAPAASPYRGPMSVSVDADVDAPVLARSGAAGRALQCATAPYSGGPGVYDDGLASVQDSPAAALDNYLAKAGAGPLALDRGYRVERDDGDRVLLSYDVDGRTKAAFVVADNVRDVNDDVGWGVTTWAECDPAEFPAAVTDEFGIGIWQDQAGRRAPAARIQSYHGATHCDWQDITFIQLGRDADNPQYVDDVAGELEPYLRTTFQEHASLPATATDTGLHRNGRELWLSADHDAAYLVSRDDPSDVQRWPAAKRFIGCA